MNLSYWEYKAWLSNIDFTVVGSGIVGLNCALQLRKRHPKAKILVLEKGVLPQGASTKNAGFACFGSISEIISDLRQHTEQEVVQLVQKRYDGIQMLRKTLGDSGIGYKRHSGGHELFLKNRAELFDSCFSQLDSVNELLFPVFGKSAFVPQQNSFGFRNIQNTYISNCEEAQIDTGRMMISLLNLVCKEGIYVLNNVAVEAYTDSERRVHLKTNRFEVKTSKLFIATNGFANNLLKEAVSPARAQVLVTNPIANLHIKGTFHLDEGYYYFRNVDNRILLGGGRNLDFEGEKTMAFGQTEIIQKRLETLLKETILPDINFKINRRWSGIMGMGKQKRPIIKEVSTNVYCGVRLGGMGIAIGSLIGKELADLT